VQDVLTTLKKLGVFCDAIKHHNESRKSGDVKVLSLALRVLPFDAKMAGAIAHVCRSTLFRESHPDPKSEITEVHFRLALPRQNVHVFAAPDTTTASLVLSDAKCWHIKAKRRTEATVYALTFDITFGPVGRQELEFVEAWRGTQKFLTFAAAEPSLEFLDGEEEEPSDDPKTRAPKSAPMFTDDGEAAPAIETTAPEPARHLPKRHPEPGTRPNSRKPH
jgi:hypothetical protein